MGTTMMQMKMNFYWGRDAIVLFSGWPGHSVGWYIVALLLVFLLAVVVELLSALPPAKPGPSRVAGGRLRNAAVHLLRIGLAYLLMLSVMSFNLGVFIVAVVGHGVGFLIARSGAGDAADRAVSLAPHNTGSV